MWVCGRVSAAPNAALSCTRSQKHPDQCLPWRTFTSLERLGNNTLGIAITLLLTGFFLMFNRRKAITQVLALLTIENGVMLAAVALTTYGMPLVVELGIFFDVMVAVMVLGILVYRIRENFASMDVGKLSQLKG